MAAVSISLIYALKQNALDLLPATLHSSVGRASHQLRLWVGIPLESLAFFVTA